MASPEEKAPEKLAVLDTGPSAPPANPTLAPMDIADLIADALERGAELDRERGTDTTLPLGRSMTGPSLLPAPDEDLQSALPIPVPEVTGPIGGSNPPSMDAPTSLGSGPDLNKVLGATPAPAGARPPMDSLVFPTGMNIDNVEWAGPEEAEGPEAPSSSAATIPLLVGTAVVTVVLLLLVVIIAWVALT